MNIGHTESDTFTLSTSSAAPSVVTFPNVDTFDDVRDDFDADPDVTPLPDRAMLAQVELEGVTGSVFPTSVVWWLTADLAGNQILTDQLTTAWVQPTAAVVGGVAARLDTVWSRRTGGGTVYLWAYTDEASDVVVRPRIVWQVSDSDQTAEHRRRG